MTDEQKRTLEGWLGIATKAIVIVGVILAVGKWLAVSDYGNAAQAAVLRDHEARIRRNFEIITDMRGDLKVVRNILEQQREKATP